MKPSTNGIVALLSPKPSRVKSQGSLLESVDSLETAAVYCFFFEDNGIA